MGRKIGGGGGGGGEGGWQFFKINILAVKHLRIHILAWVPRKIKKIMNPAYFRFKWAIS